MARRTKQALNAVFVDTSAWYPLVDAGHVDHASLSAVLRARVMKGARIVTTNLVVAETHALLMRRAGIGVARSFSTTVRLPPNLIEYATPERESEAISGWLEMYSDQDFSLTDAVSFVVMKELGIEEAIALDSHFETAGFRLASR